MQQRIVDELGICRFFRGEIACAITKSEGELYWGHVGVTGSSRFYGRLFVNLGSTRLYRVQMATSGNAALDKRWWLGFEGTSPYRFESTLAEVKRAADFLQGLLPQQSAA